MDVDPRTRGTGGTLTGDKERGLSADGLAVDRLIQLLANGPATERVAPKSITLPGSLSDALRRAAADAYSNGLEHGGVFGYFAGEPVKFGILYTEGQETSIEYPAARVWPALRRLGRFHTHLYVRALGARLQLTGWAGGGHSGTDVTNFLRSDEHASIVYAQTKGGTWKVYFLLKPQESHLPGTPGKVGEDYDRRAIALVASGADPIDASEHELKGLAQVGAFVYYTAIDSKVHGKGAGTSLTLERQL
jgi:hypothetical protein